MTITMDDIKTAITVSSFLFAIWCFSWNRRETRLKSLESLLKPLLQSLQSLNAANEARRTAERLKTAYSDPSKAPEAVRKHNSLVEDFNQLASKASDAFKEYERDLGACRFRFPDNVGKILQAAKEDLAKLGQFVNGGYFDQADIYIAKVIDHHTTVSKYARGWRLADPFEAIRKRWDNLRRKPDTKRHEHDLDGVQMTRVMDLVTKRATTQAHIPFVVHAPQKLLDDPGIAKRDDVIERLADSVFEVVFQDGTYAMLSLSELMTFTHQLIFLRHQFEEIEKIFERSDHPATVTVKADLNVPEHVMQPEMVKALLSKIEFSSEASDSDKVAPIRPEKLDEPRRGGIA